MTQNVLKTLKKKLKGLFQSTVPWVCNSQPSYGFPSKPWHEFYFLKKNPWTVFLLHYWAFLLMHCPLDTLPCRVTGCLSQETNSLARQLANVWFADPFHFSSFTDKKPSIKQTLSTPLPKSSFLTHRSCCWNSNSIHCRLLAFPFCSGEIMFLSLLLTSWCLFSVSFFI